MISTGNRARRTERDSLPISELKAVMFRAMAHPPRIRILETLSAGERSVSDLQPVIGIESSHLSQQLGVLKRAGLVTSRKEGQSVYYSLKDPLIAELLSVAKQILIGTLTETRDLLADLHDEDVR